MTTPSQPSSNLGPAAQQRSSPRTSKIAKNNLNIPKYSLISNDQIKIDEIIGRGAFGTVHIGEYNKMRVAIKKIHAGANNAQREAASRALNNEVKALTRVRHLNIVQLIAI